MPRFFQVAMLLFVCGGNASAAAYDDFARGLAANQQQDSATAIPAFTAALSAGDLNASLKPNAYHGRGLAYIRTENCAAARSDAEAALALKPDYNAARWLHAGANECLGQFASALEEYSALLAAEPVAGAYRIRGNLRWITGDFSGAVADFVQVVKLAPNYAYGVIWLALTQTRAGAFNAGEISHASSELDADEWPAPILALFIGKSTPEAVAAVAARGKGQVAIDQKCEADFYSAEWLLGRGDAAGARTLLTSAATNCPHTFVEYRDARIELARLK